MPLDREHITAASQRMLPTYPAFFGIVGLGMLVQPLERLRATPMFRFVDDHGSVRAWGLGFVALACVFIWALIKKRRRTFQLALGAGVVWMTLWSIIAAASALADLSSLTAWAWSAFIARACWASLISLESREHS